MKIAQPTFQRTTKSNCFASFHFIKRDQIAPIAIHSSPTKNPPEAEIRAGSLWSKHGALFKGTARGCYHGFCSALPGRFRQHILAPIVSDPEEKDKGNDQTRGDRHPVLSFEAKKRETLDKKLHRFRPHFLCKLGILLVQHRNFCGQNILFLYFIRRQPAMNPVGRKVAISWCGAAMDKRQAGAARAHRHRGRDWRQRPICGITIVSVARD